MSNKYNHYKDSGIEWLGEIPSHWITTKIKYLFQLGRGRVISQEELLDKGFPVYSSQTQNNGCLGYISTYDYDCQQITWTTDGVNAGTVFIRNGKHNCTNVCGTLQPEKEINIFYSYYILQYTTEFYKRPDTNGAKIMNNEMAMITVLAPPLEEQEKIAQYLDIKTQQIDELITNKQNLISLLKEQRQSIISETVTKGLNPSVMYKDSGIEWLGEIPSHWEVKKIKYVVKICNGKEILENIVDDATMIPVYGSGGIFKYTTIPMYDEPSVLFGRKGTIDIPILVEEPFWSIDTAFYTEIYIDKILIYFFYYISQTLPYDYLSTKTALPSMTQHALNNLRIFLPPLEEQQEIVDYLDIKTTKIDTLISDIQQNITQLKEYRQSLISEFVTGKQKV